MFSFSQETIFSSLALMKFKLREEKMHEILCDTSWISIKQLSCILKFSNHSQSCPSEVFGTWEFKETQLQNHYLFQYRVQPNSLYFVLVNVS